MKLFEFEAKEFFKKGGIPVSDGMVVETPEAARKAYEELGGKVVLKSQVLVCLLYTSPSPRDRTRSRMPSSA